MTYYAVIDTNVLVSAMLKYNSIPGMIMELTFNGVIVPLLNEEITAEYREVLKRAKFHFNDDIIEDVVGEMERIGLFLDAEKIDEQIPDPKDIVFYEVVMEGRKREDAYLVTGNIKHFPINPFVVTPREMLEIINKI